VLALAPGVREIHGGRNREVGQGDLSGQHQAGVLSGPAVRSITSRYRNHPRISELGRRRRKSIRKSRKSEFETK
jgi:hypothetical protein